MTEERREALRREAESMVTPRLHVPYLDDEQVMRHAVARAAKVQDVELMAVATRDEVRAELAASRFDLVVCDFQLAKLGKGVTSAELVRELRRRQIPVMVVIGDPEAAEAELGDEVPVFTKPFLQKQAMSVLGRT